MARTSNEELLDAMIRHQIGLMRVTGGIRKRIFALLDATEADVRQSVRERLRLYRGRTPTDVKRLQGLINEIKAIRGAAFDKIGEAWTDDLKALAAYEPRFTDATIKHHVPVEIETRLPPVSKLRAIVDTHPFQGRALKGWAKKVRSADLERIEAQIRIGLVQGEGVEQIARRIVGTIRLKGRDGVTQITRANAEGITRTAVNAISNRARAEYFAENKDLFTWELFVAVLDAATTPICRSLDGDRFPIGKGPMPPLHFNCRSLRTALLDPEPIGDRPMKPVTERGLLREFTAKEGLGSVTKRDDLPHGMRGRFDEFAKKRTREMIGRVPAKTSYAEFLKRQGAQFQEDVLGKTRAQLFREGGLPLKKFVNRAGDELTLSELAKREGAAFRRAGLDPEDFLR